MACLDDSGGIERRLTAKIEMAAGSLCSDENSMVAVLGRWGAVREVNKTGGRMAE